MRNFRKVILYSILLIIGSLTIKYLHLNFIADFNINKKEELSKETISHWNHFFGKWFSEKKFSWKGVPFYTKTAALMGYSYSTIGLLNIKFSNQNLDQNKLTNVSSQLVTSLINGDLTLSKNYNLRRFPKKGYGIYYGHALVVLAGHRILTGDEKHDDLIRKLAKYVYKNSIQKRTHYIIPPYNQKDSSAVFPADQSAALIGLYLYDYAFEKNLHKKPFDLMLKEIRSTKTYKKYSLDISGWNYKYQNIPRGVGLAYSFYNLAQIDRDAIKPTYQEFIRQLRQPLIGFAGIREWPQGQEKPDDVDSGPVFFNIGTAATTMSVGPSLIFDDYKTYNDLMKLQSFGGLSWGINNRSYLILDIGFLISQFFIKDKKEREVLQFFTDACLFGNTSAYYWDLNN